MIKVWDIKWDTDGEVVESLPNCLVVEDMPITELDDFLSDKYGFCHFGYKFEKLPEVIKWQEPLVLNENDMLLLKTALQYAKANIDDLNECFADYDPPDGKQKVNKIYLAGEEREYFSADDLERIIEMF